MSQAEALHLLADEQYGSHKGHSAIVQCLNKVGQYCVRPQGAWGLIPQNCQSIFCNMACLTGLTWPGQKVPRGDVISNPESLDSLPKADWWCHPNITWRWCHCRYCKISGQTSQSLGIAASSLGPKTYGSYSTQLTRWWVWVFWIDMSALSDSMLNQYRFFIIILGRSSLSNAKRKWVAVDEESIDDLLLTMKTVASQKKTPWLVLKSSPSKNKDNHEVTISDNATVMSQQTSISQIMEQITAMKVENKQILGRFDKLTAQMEAFLNSQNPPTNWCQAKGHRSESGWVPWWICTVGKSVRPMEPCVAHLNNRNHPMMSPFLPWTGRQQAKALQYVGEIH